MTSSDFIRDTAVLDISAVTSRPLLPMLTDHSAVPHPDASPDTDSHGASTNFWPWGIESSNALGDRSGQVVGFATTYVLPYEGNLYFVGHSLDSWPEPVIRLVADPDNGRAAAALVERHLSELWTALRAGAEGLPQGWGLIKVRTDRDYWFFTALLETRSTDSVDIDQRAVDTVFGAAIAVLGQVLGFPANLPGILDVLPPDRHARRIQELAEVFNTAADILGHISDVLR